MQSNETPAAPVRKRLGELLVEEGVVTPAQVEEALALQRDEYDFLGQILVRLGHVTQAQLRGSLERQYLDNYRQSPPNARG